MSADFEKPLTGADADAQRTKPAFAASTADNVGGGETTKADGLIMLEEDLGGVQGSSGESDRPVDDKLQSPPIDAPARQPDIGGGEIEWSELGRERLVELGGGDDEG